MTADDRPVLLSVVLATRSVVSGIGNATETAGLHRVWTTEFQGRDAIVRAVALGAVTTRVQVGSGIAYAFTRLPPALAAAALDAAEITGGRFTLGLGAGTRGLRRAYGAEFDPPATRLAELVTELRTTWAQPSWARPVPPPPIAIAGVNAAMLRTAAHHGDRVVLHPLCLAQDHLNERVLPAIDVGRSRRDGTDVAVSAWCIGSVDEDEHRAWARARRQLAFYLSTPGYRDVVAGTPFEASAAALREEFASATAPDWAELERHVPDELLEQVAVAGTAEQVRSGVRRMQKRLAAAGIDELVLQTVDADDEAGTAAAVHELVSSIAPLTADLEVTR